MAAERFGNPLTILRSAPDLGEARGAPGQDARGPAELARVCSGAEDEWATLWGRLFDGGVRAWLTAAAIGVAAVTWYWRTLRGEARWRREDAEAPA